MCLVSFGHSLDLFVARVNRPSYPTERQGRERDSQQKKSVVNILHYNIRLTGIASMQYATVSADNSKKLMFNWLFDN